jgi:hypothetical protein
LTIAFRPLTGTGRATIFALAVAGVLGMPLARPQSGDLHGQASSWLLSHPGSPADGQIGIRYIPDLLVESKLTDGLTVEGESSVNAVASVLWTGSGHPVYDYGLALYRAWVRLSTDRFEARVGLQKLTFGSAMMFRPLMWFDRIDPRDPLQLTEGVYGLLLRYTYQNNANFWLWGLYGNNGAKGWEISPTVKKKLRSMGCGRNFRPVRAGSR